MHVLHSLLSTPGRASSCHAILPSVGRHRPLDQAQGIQTPFWRKDNSHENYGIESSDQGDGTINKSARGSPTT